MTLWQAVEPSFFQGIVIPELDKVNNWALKARVFFIFSSIGPVGHNSGKICDNGRPDQGVTMNMLVELLYQKETSDHFLEASITKSVG